MTTQPAETTETITIAADGMAGAGKPFPGLLTSFLWIFVFFLAQFICLVIALIIVIAASGSAEEILKNSQSLAGNMAAIALPIVWSLVAANMMTLAALLIYLSRHGRLDSIHFNRWSKLKLGNTLGIGIAVIAAALCFNHVYSTYIIPGVELQADLSLLFQSIPKTMFNSILLFFMVALLAPLLEEFLFRGLLQNALAQRMPIYGAIVISAAVFSLAHVNWFAAQVEFYIFPPIFILGAAFGYLYHVTGSLRVCILLHLLNNSAALALSRFAETASGI